MNKARATAEAFLLLISSAAYFKPNLMQVIVASVR